MASEAKEIDKSPSIDDLAADTTIRNAYTFAIVSEQKKQLDDQLGWLEKKCNTLPLYNPAGSFLHCWHFCVTFMLIYTCIEVPVTFTFKLQYPQLEQLELITWYQVLSLVANLILIFDVGISFRTAYFDKFDKLMLIIDPRLIAKKYIFQGWFIVDLMTSIPFQLIPYDSDSGDELLRYFIGLIRLIMFIRLLKMWRLFNKFSREFVKIREIRHFLTLFKLLLWMFMFAHYAGCLWWFVGELKYDDDETSWIIEADADLYHSTFKKYSISFYWAVVTLFTTGYGDITATNTVEQWICALCILIGTCFFSYFIGALTVIIFEGDSTQKYKMDAIENAYHFCEHKRLSKKIRRAIITHTRYHCNYNYVFDEGEVMQTLPPHLQVDIRRDLGKQMLAQLDIFEKLSDDILGQLALKMRCVSCNAGYTLFGIGDRARDVYIQRTGECELRLNDSNETKMTTKRGCFLGEDAFLKRNRKWTVHCNTWSEFYVLAVSDITDILEIDYVDETKFHKRWQYIIDKVQSHKATELQKIDLNRAEIEDDSGEGDGFYTASRIPTMKFLGKTSVITDFTGKLVSNKTTRKVTDAVKEKLNLKNKIMSKRDSYLRDSELNRIHTKRKMSRGISGEAEDGAHLSVQMAVVNGNTNDDDDDDGSDNKEEVDGFMSERQKTEKGMVLAINLSKKKSSKLNDDNVFVDENGRVWTPNRTHVQNVSGRFSAARLSGIMNGPKLLATVDDSDSDSDGNDDSDIVVTPTNANTVSLVNVDSNENVKTTDVVNENDGNEKYDLDDFDVSFIHNQKDDDDDGDGDGDGDGGDDDEHSEHTPVPNVYSD